jgi:small conductance mechanosensitive channel
MDLKKTMDSLSDITIGKLSLMSIISVVITFLICLAAIAIIMKIVENIQKRSRLDNTLKGFIRSATKTVLWIITIIIIAGKLNVAASFVALLSVAGLALSLSLQGNLSNLFSGLTTLITKPFAAGDFVELDGISGSVSEMGLFYTTLITVDNRTVYIPNSHVTSAKIINCTRQKNRRGDFSFNVSYDTPTETVKAALMDAMKADTRILNDPIPFVGLNAFKPASVEFVLRAWVKKEDYMDVSFSLNEGMRDVFKEHGISMSGDAILQIVKQ